MQHHCCVIVEGGHNMTIWPENVFIEQFPNHITSDFLDLPSDVDVSQNARNCTDLGGPLSRWEPGLDPSCWVGWASLNDPWLGANLSTPTRCVYNPKTINQSTNTREKTKSVLQIPTNPIIYKHWGKLKMSETTHQNQFASHMLSQHLKHL